MEVGEYHAENNGVAFSFACVGSADKMDEDASDDDHSDEEDDRHKGDEDHVDQVDQSVVRHLSQGKLSVRPCYNSEALLLLVSQVGCEGE